MSDPINNRDRFFKHVQEGLQRYFDECDKKWGGVLHFTVGVREGKVGGIIKSEDTLTYDWLSVKKTKKTRKTKNNIKQ